MKQAKKKRNNTQQQQRGIGWGSSDYTPRILLLQMSARKIVEGVLAQGNAAGQQQQ